MSYSFSSLIFLAVVFITLGFFAGVSQRLNFWKVAVLACLAGGFLVQLALSRVEVALLLGCVVFGFGVPYAGRSLWLRDWVMDTLYAVRYRSAYEDIRRKETEVELLRRQYEEALWRQQQQQYQHQGQYQHQDQHSGGSQNEQQYQQSGHGYENPALSPPPKGQRAKYLRVLRLDPSQTYQYAQLKAAYRRLANKYHTDKHQHQSADYRAEMQQRFTEVLEAFTWLSVNF